MKKQVFISFALFLAAGCFAQEQQKDSILPVYLNEVILIGKPTKLNEKQVKPLASLDEYLQQSLRIDLIKRGSYAWEPMINNMATERTIVTIDGMRIFGACTDKMDPVTSYVEISNLSEATISSGQEGSCHGPTIGGALDLKRLRSNQASMGWTGSLSSGFEFNNNQRILGGMVNYKDSSMYADANLTYRKAANYFAGNNKEVLFSQFQKMNASVTTGYQFQNKLIEGSLIFDEANDVGYPALPMDISLARALITSFKYEVAPKSGLLNHWENKLYYNTITHFMDDSKRPDVPIRMDMPGWSDTYGYYSKGKITKEKHHLKFNVNGFYNRSIAEMTMYPNDPHENVMFMYTWPDVRTLYNGIYLEDEWEFSNHHSLKINSSLGFHQNKIANKFGLESLQIFYPDMAEQQNRFLKSVSLQYKQQVNAWTFAAGSGYGERAPSITEGYGFYIFNSFDLFDYIGNPNLSNEKSVEANFDIRFKKDKIKTGITFSAFHILDYIIGIPDENFIPMTIGASGVKVYNQLSYANLIHSSFQLDYNVTDYISWNNQLQYSFGKDAEDRNLPFISPLQYQSQLLFKKNQLQTEVNVRGNATQSNYSQFYGENSTPDYAILNVSAGYTFKWTTQKLLVNVGIENVLDTYYSTFTDWNNIPRMGRNVFINLSYAIGN
jgi:iron complex outermembrane receptor protein